MHKHSKAWRPKKVRLDLMMMLMLPVPYMAHDLMSQITNDDDTPCSACKETGQISASLHACCIGLWAVNELQAKCLAPSDATVIIRTTREYPLQGESHNVVTVQSQDWWSND